MLFNRLSRRHFARIAGWSALGISTKSAESSQTGASQENRLPDRSLAASFPSDFLWGTATSAYQIEGAVNEDGRGPSIWDRFAHIPGKIADHSNADVANDHYHRYKDDVQLIKALGAKAYRFSIAWPRVFPEGTGTPNPKGLDFYNRLLDELLANGIEPFATLYHWDLPQALQDRFGGWMSRDTAKAFADYAGYVAERMSDRVKTFFTINECSRLVHLGYGAGIDAPGLNVAATGAESGSSPRRAGARSRGAGDPGARSRGNQGRSGREHRRLRSRHRNAREHPCGGNRHARTQCRLSDRDAGRKIHGRLSGLCRQECPEIHRRRSDRHFVADRFCRAQRLHAQPLRRCSRERATVLRCCRSLQRFRIWIRTGSGSVPRRCIGRRVMSRSSGT